MGIKIIIGLVATFFVILILGILYQIWLSPKLRLSPIPSTPSSLVTPVTTVSLFPETGPTSIPQTPVINSNFLRATLNPVDQNFLQYGVVFISDNNGKAQVEVFVNPLSGLNQQPIHIHSGNCPGVGQVIYPLNSLNNGKSETTLSVSVAQLKSQLPLVVNIHKSNQEIQTYTSCGTLSDSSTNL